MCHYYQYMCMNCCSPISGAFVEKPCKDRCRLGPSAYKLTKNETMFPYARSRAIDIHRIYFGTLCQTCAERKSLCYDPVDPDQNLLSYPEEEPEMEAACWHIPSVAVKNVKFAEIDWAGPSHSIPRSDSESANEGLDPLEQGDQGGQDHGNQSDEPGLSDEEISTAISEAGEEVQFVLFQRASQLDTTTTNTGTDFSRYLEDAAEQAQKAILGIEKLEQHLNRRETSDADMQTLFDRLSAMLKPDDIPHVHKTILRQPPRADSAVPSTTHLPRRGNVRSLDARISLLPAPLYTKSPVVQMPAPFTLFDTTTNTPPANSPISLQTSENHRLRALALLSGDVVVAPAAYDVDEEELPEPLYNNEPHPFYDYEPELEPLYNNEPHPLYDYEPELEPLYNNEPHPFYDYEPELEPLYNNEPEHSHHKQHLHHQPSQLSWSNSSSPYHSHHYPSPPPPPPPPPLSPTTSTTTTTESFHSLPNDPITSTLSAPHPSQTQTLRQAASIESNRIKARKHLFDILARRLQQLEQKEQLQKRRRDEKRSTVTPTHKSTPTTLKSTSTSMSTVRAAFTRCRDRCGAVLAQAREHWIFSAVVVWTAVVLVLSFSRLER